jgi:hypothetical protein
MVIYAHEYTGSFLGYDFFGSYTYTHVRIRTSRSIFFNGIFCFLLAYFVIFLHCAYATQIHVYAGTEVLFLAFLIEGMPSGFRRSFSYCRGRAASMSDISVGSNHPPDLVRIWGAGQRSI